MSQIRCFLACQIWVSSLLQFFSRSAWSVVLSTDLLKLLSAVLCKQVDNICHIVEGAGHRRHLDDVTSRDFSINGV